MRKIGRTAPPRLIDPELHPEAYPAQLPEFATEEEARDFWDTHSSEPYADQMEFVYDGRNDASIPASTLTTRRRVPEGIEAVSVEFSHDFWDTVREIAQDQDLFYQDLIHDWIEERLVAEVAKRRLHQDRKHAS